MSPPSEESVEAKRMRELYECLLRIKDIADGWDGNSYDDDSNAWAFKITKLFKDSAFNFMREEL